MKMVTVFGPQCICVCVDKISVLYACYKITGCGTTATGAVSGAASCADAAVTAVVAVDAESLVSGRARVARGRAGQHEGAAAVAR